MKDKPTDKQPFSPITFTSSDGIWPYSNSKIKTTVRFDAYLWDLFKKTVRARHLPSTCFVLETLMLAWITGERKDLPRARPVTVNMTVNYKVQRPRRLPAGVQIPGEDKSEYIEKLGACFRLIPKGEFPGRIGYCMWLKLWIHGFECESCLHSRDRF